MKTILCVIGTRPEAIKMAPVIKALGEDSRLRPVLCVTSQHREMLRGALALFSLKPDFDLNVMKPRQTLAHVTSAVLSAMDEVVLRTRPDLLLVQGDTTTSMAASLAAFYHKIPVGHVEAGLRTGDIYSPWPEELNRKITGAISHLHFAPTERAKAKLLAEGVSEDHIHVTGNTVIDALFSVVQGIDRDAVFAAHMEADYPFLMTARPNGGGRKLILVTGHRRESFGEGFENICAALSDLASRPDVEILYPVHLNPNVREPVHTTLGSRGNIHLIEPVDYRQFVFFMTRAYLILTDSGGVQEEAPAIGKPVLVMRNKTEREEAVEEGTVKLVGANRERIVCETVRLLEDPDAYARMSRHSMCYGDGRAGERILRILVDNLLRS